MRRFLALGLTLVFLIGVNPTSKYIFEAKASVIPLHTSTQQSACGCRDLKDMQNRIAEAEAAVKEYQYQQKLFFNKKFDSLIYKDEIQVAVKDIIDKAHIRGTNSVGSGTHTRSCELNPITVGDPTWMRVTPCLKAAVEAHERLHMDNCVRWKDKEGFDRGLDYRNEMTMVEALGEEMSAYANEIRFLRSQIEKLPCTPPEWIGVVTYESTEKMVRTEVVPPGPSKDRLGGQTVYDYEKKHIANITVVDGKAFVEQIFALTSKKDSEYTRVLDCGGGMVNRRTVTHTFKSNDTSKMNAEGFSKALSFSVSSNGDDGYSISFRAPKVLYGKSEITSTEAPYPTGCGQPNKPTPPIKGPFNLDSELSYTIRVKGKPTDLELKGSETIPMPGGFWTIKVSWDLSRSKASNTFASVFEGQPFSADSLFELARNSKNE